MGSKKKSLIAESDKGETPELIKRIPQIENFVINTIETSPGIQIPALLSSIIDLFSREGVTQGIFSDKEFLKWINQILINKHDINVCNNKNIPSDIGRGLGTQVDYTGQADSNTDPFLLLIPNKDLY